MLPIEPSLPGERVQELLAGEVILVSHLREQQAPVMALLEHGAMAVQHECTHFGDGLRRGKE